MKERKTSFSYGSKQEWTGRALSAVAVALLALGGTGCGDDASSGGRGHPNGCPAEHDHFDDGAVVRATEDGLFTASVRFEPSPPRKGTEMLVVHLTDASGAPVTGAALQVTATMPAHGHGLGAMPHVEETGEGNYMVHNVFFQMAGHWVLTLEVSAGEQTDAVEFVLCVADSDAGVPDGGGHVHPGDAGTEGGSPDGGLDGGTEGEAGLDGGEGTDAGA